MSNPSWRTRLDTIARGHGAWFDPAGPDADLVLSTRVRLSRNVAGVRFPTRASEADLTGIVDDVQVAAAAVPSLVAEDTLPIQSLEPLDTQLLIERHLISAESAGIPGTRAFVPGIDDGVSVMVNEEDHIRIQGLVGGLQLYECWERACEVDQGLSASIDFAFHDEFGFLTTCPSNVGTGLRVSVLLHLPCLVLSERARGVIDDVKQVGLSVRGFYGEGSDVQGNFLQISNQITLGKSEEDLLDMVENVTREVMRHEIEARDYLWTEARPQIQDKIHRALGTLENCRLISAAEVVAAASALRLGISLGMEGMPDPATLNRLVVFAQPAHVECVSGRSSGTSDRRALRAELVRSLLRPNSATNGEF